LKKKSVAKRYMYMDPSRLAMQDPVYVRKKCNEGDAGLQK
jgi:hypothetical protein